MIRTMRRVVLVAASLGIAACSMMQPKRDPTPAPISEIVVVIPDSQSEQNHPLEPVPTQTAPKQIVPEPAIPEPMAPKHVLSALATEQIGYYMDIQEAKFRQLLGVSDIYVQRAGETITLTVPSAISFESHRTQLLEVIKPLLASISSVLVEFDKTLVTIRSYTDTIGSEIHNQQLSEQRGESVASFLLAGGVSSQRLRVIGFGETRPVAPNNTNHGRVLNRRIELVLEPVPM